jgi:hypothetical protein
MFDGVGSAPRKLPRRDNQIKRWRAKTIEASGQSSVAGTIGPNEKVQLTEKIDADYPSLPFDAGFAGFYA